MSRCLSPLLPPDWRCPGCDEPAKKSDKPIILHHDHLEDVVRDLANQFDGQRSNVQRHVTIESRIFVDTVLLYRRFRPTPLCTDCNNLDGHNLKKKYGAAPGFSFDVQQIRSINKSGDRTIIRQRAFEQWKNFESEYEVCLSKLISGWGQAISSYEPSRDFQYPIARCGAFDGLTTVFDTLTYRNASWVCSEAIKLIRNNLMPMKPPKALERSFRKRLSLNSGRQTKSTVYGIKRDLL